LRQGDEAVTDLGLDSPHDLVMLALEAQSPNLAGAILTLRESQPKGLYSR
jgi:hypothetical protein